MKKVICNTNECKNKSVTYFMPIDDQKVMCGGCKVWIEAISMTATEIAATFDYDYNAPSIGSA